MTSNGPSPEAPRFGTAAQWLLLALGTAPLTALFYWLHVPAALLLGPMLVAVAAGINGAAIRVPRPVFGAAQALIGCLVALSISPGIYRVILDDWPVITASVLATLAASALLGWLISYFKILPGATAMWGTTPGGASAMVIMASAFGADARLVAFMQYLRVIFVTTFAVAISGIVLDRTGGAPPAENWLAPVSPAALAATLAVAGAGALIGRLVRLPSPFFLGPIIAGVIVHLGFGIELQIPVWLKFAAYIGIGWAIGLGFTRDALALAIRALPQIVASIIVLIAFCGAIGWLVSRELGVDPLTAYLATSPGGLDTVAIIALASPNRVDLSFILAVQTARLIAVLLLIPAFAKWLMRFKT